MPGVRSARSAGGVPGVPRRRCAARDREPGAPQPGALESGALESGALESGALQPGDLESGEYERRELESRELESGEFAASAGDPGPAPPGSRAARGGGRAPERSAAMRVCCGGRRAAVPCRGPVVMVSAAPRMPLRRGPVPAGRSSGEHPAMGWLLKDP
ncbi:hypothetical protein GCM10009601_14290 [Streptomyces thermospinosisporus]|uniref:Uncharacterized protein n=1 Tax=Streptomyces thermospinosisporus TaxID=161482 RepID=A0ABP4JCI4_9ACTN